MVASIGDENSALTWRKQDANRPWPAAFPSRLAIGRKALANHGAAQANRACRQITTSKSVARRVRPTMVPREIARSSTGRSLSEARTGQSTVERRRPTKPRRRFFGRVIAAFGPEFDR